jgi:hypothetical protein
MKANVPERKGKNEKMTQLFQYCTTRKEATKNILRLNYL